MEITTKRCSQCGLLLPRDAFYKNAQQASGLSCDCRGCRAAWGVEYRQKNKEKIAADKAEYQQKNKEKIAAYNAGYQQKNKEKIAAVKAEYRQKNKEKLAADKAEYRQKNKEKIAAYKAEYRQKNKEKIKDWGRRDTEELSDSYIKKLINHDGIFKSQKMIPPELVSAYRENLKLKRLIKEQRA